MSTRRDITQNVSNPQFPTGALIKNDLDTWIIKDTSVTGTIYYGYATIGSNTSDSVWKIRRDVTSGGVTVVEYADGDANFDNIWNDRTSLSYE